MDGGMYGNDYMGVPVGNLVTPYASRDTEQSRSASNGNQNTKGQEKNNDQRRRQRESQRYEYSDEPDAVDELLKIIKKQESEIETLKKRNEVLEKQQDKNNEQRRRQHEPKKYEYSDETNAVDELLKIIEKQKSKIKMLEKNNEVLEKRSKDITKGMAKVVESKGNFENVNDNLANTNVTETFNNMYDGDWAKLSKWLGQTFPRIQEIEMIHSLTALMRMGYRECLRLADDQIRHFLLLDASQDIPTTENHQELYAVRKKYTQTSSTRTKIKRMVLDKILHAEENKFFYEGVKHQETEQRLQDFFTKYLDCCWLMVVSNPPISLNFDVIGKLYCKDHFRKYSPKKPVEDKTKDTDTVCEVVWPCVCLQDGSAFYKKGDVIVVTKEMTNEEKNENSECSCLSVKVNDGQETQIQETSAGNEEIASGSSKEKSARKSKTSKQSDVQ